MLVANPGLSGGETVKSNQPWLLCVCGGGGGGGGVGGGGGGGGGGVCVGVRVCVLQNDQTWILELLSIMRMQKLFLPGQV